MKTPIALGLAAILAACAVGPDHVPPATPRSAALPFLGSRAIPVSTAEPEGRWWRLYDDPVLDRMVKEALRANSDIRVAVARLERSRAALRGARSEQVPTGTIGAGANFARIPESQALPGADREVWLADTGISISYELDLFGRVRRAIEAARGDLAAAAADAQAVRLAIAADTARAYADAASSAERLAVARQTVALLDQSVRLVGRRQEAGRDTRFDLLRITALRDQRAATVPGLEAERQAALFRLATLIGRTPQDLPAEATERTTTPRVARPVPVGDGAGLIARRPDVQAAERRLAADTARIGIATAELYPRVVLGASLGANSAGFGDLFTAGALRSLVGPMISWTFLNREAVRARIDASRADASGSLARFDGAVLRALEETETALANYRGALGQRHLLQAASEQAEGAARIVRARRREGQVDFLEVLDAERTAAEARAELAASDARIAHAQIDLFRALGGGWDDRAADRISMSQ